MSNSIIAVVILNYNGRKFLEKFLSGVLVNSPQAEVIVIDNASTDDSKTWLHYNYPQLRLIELPQNLGFAGGYNAGLAQIDAKYFVLLNSDVAVTPNWLSAPLKLLENNEQIAACQPKIKSEQTPEYFEYAGGGGGFIDYLGYPFCRGRLFDTLELDQAQYDDIRPVFWATGACLIVRSEIFNQLGGLDGDFFAHMEEIDFAWRLQRAGYQVYYCGGSEVFHVGGGTLPKANPQKTFLNFRNSLAMLYKNLPPNQVFYKLFLKFFLDALAIVLFLLKRQPKDAQAIIKAYWSFYNKLGHWRSKRQAVNLPYPKQLKYVLPKSLVFQYFLLGRKQFQSLAKYLKA